MNVCQTHESAQLWTALTFTKPKYVPSDLTLSLRLFPQTLKDSYHTSQGFSCTGQSTKALPFSNPEAILPESPFLFHSIRILQVLATIS